MEFGGDPRSEKLGRSVKASLYGFTEKHLEGYHELVEKLEISTIGAALPIFDTAKL